MKNFNHYANFQIFRNFSKKFIKIKINPFSKKSTYDEQIIYDNDTDFKVKGNNKLDIIKNNEKYNDSKYQSGYYFNEGMIENATLSEIMSIMKGLVKSKNENSDVWYRVINKFNDYLCNHQVSKRDAIDFLDVLDFFLPKILEKRVLPKDHNQIGSKISFNKRHEEEYLKTIAPKDLFTQFALHIKKHLKASIIVPLLKETVKYQNVEDVDEDLDDLIGLYEITFKNLELKVIDDIRNGRAEYSHQDCVDLIKSFSRAQEGTNMLYEVLMRKIAKHAHELSINEIEIIMNYLPHDLYNNEESKDIENTENVVEKGKTFEISEFYKIALDTIGKNIHSADDVLFISLWQGVLKMKFVELDLINTFLTNFDNRINIKEKNKQFYFDFLQILTYFVKIEENQKYLNSLDFELIYKSIYETFIKKNLHSFNLKEIDTCFWIFHNFQEINLEKIKLYEPAIKDILLGYINDPKENIDNGGYETGLRYYSNYQIDPYDVEALSFFISENKEYKGELINLLKKTLKLIELENTHPISRKKFHF